MAVGLALTAWGQGKSTIKIDVPTITNWKAPIAGDDGRTVMEIRGSKATPSLASGQMEVTDFRLETYRYTPDQVRVTELVVESPLGRFGTQGAGSGERLTLKSPDDRFLIEGTGWSWSRASGLLVVSNAVETRVRRGLEETNRPPIQVRARRFEYHLRNGDARYIGDCIAEDPGRARVTAGELRSRLSPTQTQPEAIHGTNGVVIDLLRADKPGRAEGAGATYTAATKTEGERIELHGNPTWRFGPSQGAADHLLLLPTQDAYTASGHARLKLLGATKATDPRKSGGTNAPPREAVEIACEKIEANSTNVVLTGPVTARQGDRLELQASHLVAALGPDPKSHELSVMSAKATGDVMAKVGQGDQAIELRGQTMTYALGEPSSIDVDGEPAWRAREHSGAARHFRIHPETEVFEAVDDVRVRWASVAKTEKPAPVDIAAATMRVDGDRAAFRGDVRATGPRWEMAAGEVDFGLGTNRTVRAIEARGDVLFLYEMLTVAPATNGHSRTMMRLLGSGEGAESRRWEIKARELKAAIDEKGEDVSRLDASGGVTVRHPAVQARGGRLEYLATDGQLRLLDNAELQAADGLDIVGLPETVLTMDPRHLRFGVEGPVRRWRLPASSFRERVSTNAVTQP
jgi:lipopolysaccharide export system protein LptA